MSKRKLEYCQCFAEPDIDGNNGMYRGCDCVCDIHWIPDCDCEDSWYTYLPEISFHDINNPSKYYSILFRTYDLEGLCTHIEGRMMNQKREEIGTLEAKIFESGPGLFSRANASQETLDMAKTLFEDSGEVRSDYLKENVTFAFMSQHEILYLSEININEEYRHQDLSLYFIQSLLDTFDDFTIFITQPYIPSTSVVPNYEQGQTKLTSAQMDAHDEMKIKLCKHFARIGLTQVKGNDDEIKIWYLDGPNDGIISKESVADLVVEFATRDLSTTTDDFNEAEKALNGLIEDYHSKCKLFGIIVGKDDFKFLYDVSVLKEVNQGNLSFENTLLLHKLAAIGYIPIMVLEQVIDTIGCDIHYIDPYSGCNILHAACVTGIHGLEVIKFLSYRDVNKTLLNKRGKSPLQVFKDERRHMEDIHATYHIPIDPQDVLKKEQIIEILST